MSGRAARASKSRKAFARRQKWLSITDMIAEADRDYREGRVRTIEIVDGKVQCGPMLKDLPGWVPPTQETGDE